MERENISGIDIRCLVVGMVQTNCYIISNKKTKEAVVIDPGDSKDAVCSQIKRDGLDLKAVLLTHGHFDHIMAAAGVAGEFGAKIYAGEKEEALLKDSRMNCSNSIGKDYGLQAEVYLKDGEEIILGGMKIKVIHTPGHTAGGMCYYFEEAMVLVSGDTLFCESIGRTDLPTGNMKMLLESVNSKLMLLDDQVTVLPGHGEATTVGYERKNNSYINGKGF